MPRFVCYCPDYPNSLERRLSVRAQHLVAAKADLAKGENEMGRQSKSLLPRLPCGRGGLELGQCADQQ